MVKYVILFLFLSFFVGKLSFAATSTVPDPGIVSVDSTASEGDKNNQLASSLCQIILLLNGRTGRAIFVIAAFGVAFLFMTNKLNVIVFLTFIGGGALLFGAKSIALTMLPYYVSVKDPDRGLVNKTPDELIRQVCPELK